MRISLISIGDELLNGATVDTNTAWLAARLHARGCAVVSHRTIGDDRPLIAAAVRDEIGQADVIITTGGLGPTDDDLTREGVADALGVGLHTDAAAEAHLRAFFARIGRRLTPTQFRQAMLPDGCELIPNPWGTAPAFAARAGNGCRIYVLPGVPSEMRGIFGASILPRLAGELGGRCTLVRVVRCFGATEAYVGEQVSDLMTRGRNPAVGITAADAIIGIRINATADTPAAAAELLDADLEMVRQRLGSYVFGEHDPLAPGGVEPAAANSPRAITRQQRAAGFSPRGASGSDPAPYGDGGSADELTAAGSDPASVAAAPRGVETLQEAVAALLTASRQTLATAESCTGGLLSKLLTDVAGSSAFFLRGYVTYANSAKTDLLGVSGDALNTHGAVSEAVAIQMAEGCRRAAGSDFSLSITGIAGPGGGSDDKPVGLVYLGAADASGTTVRRVQFGQHLSRRDIRVRACHSALNLLRLRLIEGSWRAS